VTQYDLESQWIAKDGVPGVSYRFSESVRIKSGEYSGQVAEVIALISVEPEPIYVVVLPPKEKSVVLPQSELEATGSAGGRTLELRTKGS